MKTKEKLSEIVSELKTIFTRRREIEKRIKEGQASEADHIELKTINQELQE